MSRFQNGLDNFGQIWTTLDRFRQIWTDLDKISQENLPKRQKKAPEVDLPVLTLLQ